jgi:two-component system NtrC family sensor kinase
MLTARHAAIRLLKLMMVASLVLPAVLFAFAAWVSYRNFVQVTDERIDRSLDILHEHALKVLQTVERTFAEIDEIMRGMSDDDIRRNEASLHARLERIVHALPQLQGIAIMDRSGHPLITSSIASVPKEFDFSDRDYFQAQASGHPGTYVSGLHEPRMGSLGPYFFALSQRRPSDDGRFNGIVTVALLPNYFEAFYARMGRSDGSYFAMARADGAFLARYPVPKDRSISSMNEATCASVSPAGWSEASTRSKHRSIKSNGASVTARSPASRSMCSPARKRQRSRPSGSAT